MTPPVPLPRLASEPVAVKPADAAELLGIGLRTLQDWTRDGFIPSIHRGGIRLYSVSALRKLPPMHLHDTRHTAATLMLASGATLDDVKRALGHTSIAITSDIYGHLVAARQRQLADALDEAVS